MLEDLLQAFRQGKRHALARLLSLLARGEHVEEILAALPKSTTGRTVALTGSAGVGKSTLVGKLIETIRATGKSVAVLACDPQSPLSGGALLGDRFRMPATPDDTGVYIRSLSTPGGQGAILQQLPEMIQLLKAFGFDVILIETVGAGQGDTEVYRLVDVLVLLLQPETGDDLQWEKAGVLEVADIVAVQKADLPGAEQVEAQVKTMLHLSDRPSPEILSVSARTGKNVEKLWQVIESRAAHSHVTEGQDLLKRALAVLTRRYHQAERERPDELDKIVQSWRDETLPELEVIKALCDLLLRSES